MTSRKWAMLVAVLVLVGAAAALLTRLQNARKLGPPGLRMVDQPVYDETGAVVCSNTVALPDHVPGFKSRVLPISANEINWLPRDTTFARRLYETPETPNDGFAVLMTVVLMGTDRGSIHKPQICLVGQGWTIERSDVEYVAVNRPHPYRLPVMKLTAAKQARTPGGQTAALRSLYVYWFVSEKEVTARHGERMWWSAKELLRSGTFQRWAYVSCLAHCLPGQEDAVFARLKDFIAAAVPEFQLVTGAPGGGERSLAGLDGSPAGASPKSPWPLEPARRP